jgi:uncharacterized Zn-finger protein
LTTNEHFERAKRFVTETLPKIWAKLDNNFLEDLPASVHCPRLTTSNLTDAATTKTAQMLAKARIPDAVTVASKWSTAPKINKPPTSAVVVNYSTQSFPALKSTTKKSNNRSSHNRHEHSTDPNFQALDNASTHSASSATSAGTNFTREEGQSLFTSMTNSILSDLKSQSESVTSTLLSMAALQATMCTEQVEQNERNDARFERAQKERHAEQVAQNERTDTRFERMMTAFMQHSTKDTRDTLENTATTPATTKETRETNLQTPAQPDTPMPQPHPPNSDDMDISHEDNRITDPVQRPMETEDRVTYPDNQSGP